MVYEDGRSMVRNYAAPCSLGVGEFPNLKKLKPSAGPHHFGWPTAGWAADLRNVGSPESQQESHVAFYLVYWILLEPKKQKQQTASLWAAWTLAFLAFPHHEAALAQSKDQENTELSNIIWKWWLSQICSASWLKHPSRMLSSPSVISRPTGCFPGFSNIGFFLYPHEKLLGTSPLLLTIISGLELLLVKSPVFMFSSQATRNFVLGQPLLLLFQHPGNLEIIIPNRKSY